MMAHSKKWKQQSRNALISSIISMHILIEVPIKSIIERVLILVHFVYSYIHFILLKRGFIMMKEKNLYTSSRDCKTSLFAFRQHTIWILQY